MRKVIFVPKSNYGYRFFMFCFSGVLALPGVLALFGNNDFNFVFLVYVSFGLYFGWMFLSIVKNFILNFGKKVSYELEVDNSVFIWKELKNNIVANEIKIERNIIQEAKLEIHYYLGNYNFFYLTFSPINTQHLTTSIHDSPLLYTLKEDDVVQMKYILKNYNWIK